MYVVGLVERLVLHLTNRLPGDKRRCSAAQWMNSYCANMTFIPLTGDKNYLTVAPPLIYTGLGQPLGTEKRDLAIKASHLLAPHNFSMGIINFFIDTVIIGWRKRLEDASLPGKAAFGCITLLLMACCCAVPLVLINKWEPTPTSIPSLDDAPSAETAEPAKAPTMQPAATPLPPQSALSDALCACLVETGWINDRSISDDHSPQRH